MHIEIADVQWLCLLTESDIDLNLKQCIIKHHIIFTNYFDLYIFRTLFVPNEQCFKRYMNLRHNTNKYALYIRNLKVAYRIH